MAPDVHRSSRPKRICCLCEDPSMFDLDFHIVRKGIRKETPNPKSSYVTTRLRIVLLYPCPNSQYKMKKLVVLCLVAEMNWNGMEFSHVSPARKTNMLDLDRLVKNGITINICALCCFSRPRAK